MFKLILEAQAWWQAKAYDVTLLQQGLEPAREDRSLSKPEAPAGGFDLSGRFQCGIEADIRTVKNKMAFDELKLRICLPLYKMDGVERMFRKVIRNMFDEVVDRGWTSKIGFGCVCRATSRTKNLVYVWIRRLKSFFIRPIKDKARYMDSSSNQFYTNILKKKQILR